MVVRWTCDVVDSGVLLCMLMIAGVLRYRSSYEDIGCLMLIGIWLLDIEIIVTLMFIETQPQQLENTCPLCLVNV